MVPLNAGWQKHSSCVNCSSKCVSMIKCSDLLSLKERQSRWWNANFINASCVSAHTCTNRTLIWIFRTVVVCLLMVMESLLKAVESLFWRGCCWGVEAAFLPPLWCLPSSHIYSDHAERRIADWPADMHHLLRLFFHRPHMFRFVTRAPGDCRQHYETGFSVTELIPST